MARRVTYLLFATLVAASAGSAAQSVPVRYLEGVLHGFVILKTLDGAPVADGDLTQTVQGDEVTVRAVFRFRDGSVHDETAVYSQRQRFQLITDHLVQKGPTFPQPLEMTIDVAGKNVTVKYTEGGQAKVASERIDLPADVSNGLLPNLLKNLHGAPPKTVSYVAATPKPRLVKLALSVAGDEPFTTGALTRHATHYVLKVEIGGLLGLIAPIFGKQPPDSHVWILEGEAPAFVKAEQALFLGGPVWRIEITGGTFPRTTPVP